MCGGFFHLGALELAQKSGQMKKDWRWRSHRRVLLFNRPTPLGRFRAEGEKAIPSIQLKGEIVIATWVIYLDLMDPLLCN